MSTTTKAAAFSLCNRQVGNGYCNLILGHDNECRVTESSATYTPGLRAAQKVSEYLKSLGLDSYYTNTEMAEIIDRETAAPEMLEALESLLHYKNLELKELIPYTVKLAEAAIQKARGGK